ncbi:RHS repeat-associated core domain-containing protein, partial [Flavobacterium collinsii]|uniref:RHS repeat-associated core domain-containing protein n=1 Tax=Flavobacterium collinsii TaxID=1114861 RepID=UPI0027E5B777
MYDMEARNYMPDVGRWGSIDELTESFFNFSPYNFSNNNPIFFSDPSGLAPESSNYHASTVVNRTGKVLDYKN